MDDILNNVIDLHKLSDKIVIDVVKGNIKLHDVVEQLEPRLTNTNPSERGTGVQILSDVLHGVPQDLLDSEQLTFLSKFYSDRLKDHHSVVPNVIYGITTLVLQKSIKNEDIANCLQSLFQEVHCQSQVINDRRNIYTLLRSCLMKRLEAVQLMGQNFTHGFITAMDGEKDPRNLVLLFSLIPIIIQHINLGPFTEEIFEVVAAYFPIDFVPPSSDPFGITSEDLVLGLRHCLSSSRVFAPFCLPLLQEKLDSDLVPAKLDALHTLTVCCNVYNHDDLRPHLPLLWQSIRREIVENLVDELEVAAKSTLTTLVSALERNPTTHTSRKETDFFINSVLEECLCHLNTPDQRLMLPSGQILLSMAAGNCRAGAIICDKVLPLLSNQFKDNSGDNSHKNTLIILSKFLMLAARHPALHEESESLETNESNSCDGVEDIKCNLPPSLTAASVVSLSLSHQQLHQSAQLLATQLFITKDNELRDLIMDTLINVGENEPTILEEFVFIPLLQNIELNGSINNLDEMLNNVTYLASRCTNFFIQVLPMLWNAVEQLHLQCNYTSQSTLYLNCISKIVHKIEVDEKLQHFLLIEWEGIKKCIFLSLRVIYSTIMINPNPNSSLDLIGDICRIIITKCRCPTSSFVSLIELILETAYEERTQSNMSLQFITTLTQSLSLLEISGDKRRIQYLIYPLQGLMLSLPPEDIDKLQDTENLFATLLNWSLLSENDICRQKAAMLLAVNVNKLVKKADISLVLSIIDLQLRDALCNEKNTCNQLGAINTWTMVTKALVIRGHSLAKSWINELTKLLTHDRLGEIAAQSYGEILKDHKVAFLPETNATIRLLYKQQFFESNLPLLLGIYQNDDSLRNNNALLAIISMLRWIPQLVLKTYITKLLPLILQGLNQDKSDGEQFEDLVTESVVTLASLLDDAPNEAQPHVASLVNCLIKLAKDNSTNLEARMKSLQSLNSLAALPTTTILPYRQEVVGGLKFALNDKKRIVRQSAAEARMAWSFVGAPGC